MKKPPFSDYAKYTQLAYQIVATLAVFMIAGFFADKFSHTLKPWFTLFAGVIGVVVALYILIKTTTNKDE